MAVSLVAVVPVLLALAHPLGGLGDGEGVPPGGGEEALASGDPLQHQGHGGGRQGEREQQDHMVWRKACEDQPGMKTLVQTVELLMACPPGEVLPAQVMKLVKAVEQQTSVMEQHTSAMELQTAAVEQQKEAVEKQKEAVEQQTAALLLGPVSVSLPLSLQEVAALARREEELARLLGHNRGVSMRMENRFIFEGATGAVEEAKGIFRNFVDESLNHGRSREEELVVARNSRNIEMIRSEEASEVNLLVPTNSKDCSVQLINSYETDAQVETGGKEANSQKTCRENVQLKLIAED